MGAWGPDVFENDRACDWAAQFTSGGGLDLVNRTIASIGDAEHRAHNWPEALAACDVVARLRGRRGQVDEYTEDIDAWVEEWGIEPDAGLVETAVRALDLIAGDPEIASLWLDGDRRWLARVAALRTRLVD